MNNDFELPLQKRKRKMLITPDIIDKVPCTKIFGMNSEENRYIHKNLREQTEYLGIRTIFDSDFLTEDMEKQYEKDSSYALALLLSGKEVPKEVQDRLIKMKELREKEK